MNGNLSVSRAIGDAKLKHLVVGDADVDEFALDGTEDYLIVACDGVWDVLNEEEVVKCVNDHLARPEGSKQSVAKAIVEFARSEGSGDNMTVIVVFFSQPEEGVTLSTAQDTAKATPTTESAPEVSANSHGDSTT